jgi:hypothetical protein
MLMQTYAVTEDLQRDKWHPYQLRDGDSWVNILPRASLKMDTDWNGELYLRYGVNMLVLRLIVGYLSFGPIEK